MYFTETNGDAKHNETVEDATTAEKGDAGDDNGEPAGDKETDKAETDKAEIGGEEKGDAGNGNGELVGGKEIDNEKAGGEEKSALDDVKADAGEAGTTTKVQCSGS